MHFFVDKGSIVREIWGKADSILFIFAGASAEFSLNKAVDWLYFTGRLPADPLGRLFSTVSYARLIVFSEHDEAMKAIDKIAGIHQAVEQSRGAQIPDWAYRDVLFMLIDYSIRSFELLERKLTRQEKEEVFKTFSAVGNRMQIKGLPQSFAAWEMMREQHLEQDLSASEFTHDLYQQYRKHLGPVRFPMLKQVQRMIVPERVKMMLPLGRIGYMKPVLSIYKGFRIFGLEKYIRNMLLPQDYKSQIIELDLAHVERHRTG